jgi:hypothetical protein
MDVTPVVNPLAPNPDVYASGLYDLSRQYTTVNMLEFYSITIFNQPNGYYLQL